jgi:hypothetical protein
MGGEPAINLTDALIDTAMQRAETAVYPPGDARCYGFSNGAEYARTPSTPSGWAQIGWVAADSGRTTWDTWYTLDICVQHHIGHDDACISVRSNVLLTAGRTR